MSYQGIHTEKTNDRVGLVAASDMAIAGDAAFFAVSAVRLGLTPALISPFVLQALCARQASRYVSSPERFDAAEPRRIGLVHEVVAYEARQSRAEEIIRSLLDCGPNVQIAGKPLVTPEASAAIDDRQRERLVRLIAHIRAGDEGQKDIGAFLEKRTPNWSTLS